MIVPAIILKFKNTLRVVAFISVLGNLPLNALAQENVLSLFKSENAQADEYFKKKNYTQALALYLDLNLRQNDDEVKLKIASCYYFLNQTQEAVMWYQSANETENLHGEDIFRYAEALSKLGSYDLAVEWYYKYLREVNNDPLVKKKIWRIKNRNFLYEDSIHFSVKPLSINTEFADINSSACGDTLVFLSNRKRKSIIEKVDGNSTSFFRLYGSPIEKDSLTHELVNRYEKPTLFCRELKSKFHEGPATFYDHNKRMVFVANGAGISKNEKGNTLQLFFAARVNGKWKVAESFPFNSGDYSISNAWISPDGHVIYFSSDMKGGFGGKDIYTSRFIDNRWSKPVNLGSEINTSADESFPFVYRNTFYFTSSGHAGLGGLDVFKSIFHDDMFDEVQNMGYPVNTNADDFAFTLNEDGVAGYLTSNRNGNDDVYAVEIDLQLYPFAMSGVLKYKEATWRDSTSVKVLPNADLSLIDNFTKATVATTTSDENGAFSFSIPYFSQYFIKVKDNHSNEDAFVSLDLSKRRTEGDKYEIVVVRSIFKSDDDGANYK
jgi:tetratricopeptide (TPR) repeat protein